MLPPLMVNKKYGGFWVNYWYHAWWWLCVITLFESFRYTGLFSFKPQAHQTECLLSTQGQRRCIFFLGALACSLSYHLQIRRVSWNLIPISHLWIRTCENSLLPPILCHYSQYFLIALSPRVWDEEFFLSVRIVELVLRSRDRVHGCQWFFPRLSSYNPACRRVRIIRGVYIFQEEPRRGKVGATGKLCGVGHVFLFVIAADTLVEHLILQISLFLSVLQKGRTI